MRIGLTRFSLGLMPLPLASRIKHTMSPFLFVLIASTDGERLRRHTVPVLARSKAVIVRKRNDGSRTPPLFARGESSQSLTLKLAGGMAASSPTYIESKWLCAADADGNLTLPVEAIASIEAVLKSQEVSFPDGSTTNPWRLATAEEASTLVETTDMETRQEMSSLLAQHGLNAPFRGFGAPAASVVNAEITGRIEAMEAELASLRAEKAQRDEAARREAEKAALRAELLDELRADLAKEQAAKVVAEKQAAEQAELVSLRAELAKVKAAKKGTGTGE